MAVRHTPKYSSQCLHTVNQCFPGKKRIVSSGKFIFERKIKSKIVIFFGNVKSQNTFLDKRKVIPDLPDLENKTLFRKLSSFGS